MGTAVKPEEDPASRQCEGRSPLPRPKKEYIQGDGKQTEEEPQKSREASVEDSKGGGGDGSIQPLMMSMGFGGMLVPWSEEPHGQRRT